MENKCQLIILQVFLEAKKPQERIGILGLSYGRIFDIKKWSRINCKSGLIYGIVNNPENFQLDPNPAFFGRNYIYERVRTYTMGLLFEPSFEFIFSDDIGMALGFFSILSTETNLAGIQLTVISGDLR